MFMILCLIKTLLRKTHWDKNSVKEKEYTIIINVASLKTLPGKPSGTKPWLRKKEYSMILSLIENKITFTFSHNRVNFTPPHDNITFVSIVLSIVFHPKLFKHIFIWLNHIFITNPTKMYSSNILINSIISHISSLFPSSSHSFW